MPSRMDLGLLLGMTVLTYAPSIFAADSDPWIARDKAFHFDASAGIAALTYAVSAGWVVDARWQALTVGGSIALGVGASKELLDATRILGGDPSWRDFAWDVIGTTAGLAMAWGIDLLLGGVSQSHPALRAPSIDHASTGLLLRF